MIIGGDILRNRTKDKSGSKRFRPFKAIRLPRSANCGVNRHLTSTSANLAREGFLVMGNVRGFVTGHSLFLTRHRAIPKRGLPRGLFNCTIKFHVTYQVNLREFCASIFRPIWDGVVNHEYLKAYNPQFTLGNGIRNSLLYRVYHPRP